MVNISLLILPTKWSSSVVKTTHFQKNVIVQIRTLLDINFLQLSQIQIVQYRTHWYVSIMHTLTLNRIIVWNRYRLSLFPRGRVKLAWTHLCVERICRRKSGWSPIRELVTGQCTMYILNTFRDWMHTPRHIKTQYLFKIIKYNVTICFTTIMNKMCLIFNCPSNVQCGFELLFTSSSQPFSNRKNQCAILNGVKCAVKDDKCEVLNEALGIVCN